MSKRKNLLLLSLAAVFSAAVLVGCGETVDPTPGPVEETGYTLTVSKDSNVSEVVISDANGALSDLTGIEEGTRLSATVTCVTDYEVSTVVFDGVTISPTNGVYNFVMPGKDATLAVTSVKSTVYSAITVEADDGVASFSITDRGMEVSDLTNVAEGTELVISATPAAHFEIIEVSLNGTALEANTNGTWSFTMPAASVEVGIASEQFEYAIRSVIPMQDMVNYNLDSVKLSREDGSAIADGDYVEAGSKVVVSVVGVNSWGGYYSNPSTVFINVNGNVYNPTSENIDADDRYVLNYTIDMPETDATVYVSFNNSVSSQENGGVKVTLDLPEGLEAINYSADAYYSSSNFSLIVKRVDGFLVDTITYSDADNETLSINTSNIKFYGDYGYFNLNPYSAGLTGYEFVNDYTIAFAGSIHETQAINYVNADKISGGANFVKSCIPGEYVSISNITPADSNSSISAIKVEGLAEGVEGAFYSQWEGWSIYFQMPANEITITFTVVENGEVTVVTGEGIKEYHLQTSYYYNPNSSDVVGGAPGATLYLHVVAEDGFLPPNTATTNIGENGTTLTLNSGSDYYGNPDYYYSFTMPADGSDVTITVPDAVPTYTVSAQTSDVARIDLDTTAASEGAEVTFSIYLSSALYNLDDVYIVEDESIDVTFTQSQWSVTSYSGSFTMPAKNVTLAIKTSEKPKITTAFSIGTSVDDVNVDDTFTAIRVSNSNSNVSESISSAAGASSSFEFLENSSTSITIEPAAGYEPKVYCTAGGTETEVSGNFGGGTYSYNITIAANTTAIRVEMVKATPVTYNVTADDSVNDGLSSLDYTCSVDGVEVAAGTTNFGDVYLGSYVDLVINTPPESGYNYVVTFTNASTGYELSYDANKGGYYVAGNFNVTISLVQSYSVTFINETNGTIPNSSSYFALYTSNYSNIYDGDIILASETVRIRPYISIPYGTTVTYSFTLTIGEEVVCSGTDLTSTYADYSTYYLVDGDVEFHVWLSNVAAE